MARTCLSYAAMILTLLLLAACGGGGSSSTTLTVPVSTASPSIFFAHSVAFRNHTALTWGNNTLGELGNGTIFSNAVPSVVPLFAATGVTVGGISAGGTHTLAFSNRSSGRVWAWGNNASGQLGDDTTLLRYIPVPVLGIRDVRAVAAGGRHSLALKNDGTVSGWGNNGEGQVGTGNISLPFYYMTPQPVSTVSGIIAIAAGGSHSLALDSGGKVWTWGANTYGQLGDTRANSPVPMFNNVSGVRKIAAGGSHSVALRNDGTVWTWGYNHFGQLGNGSISDSATPGPVKVVVSAGGAPLANVIDISAGLDHTVALLADGNVWAWGYNGIGQLGNFPIKVSSTAYQAYPVQVKDRALQPLTNVKQVAAFGHHTIAVKNDGTVWAWGNNIYGQLGVATIETPNTYSGVAIQVPISGISLY